jgi:hypothetical protein
LLFACTLSSACTWFNDDPFERDTLRVSHEGPEQVDAKLGRFERCRASLNPILDESWTRYQKVVGKKGKVSPRDRYFGIERARFRTCSVAIADGLAMEPSMPELEAAAKAVRDIASEYAERTRWHGRHDGEGVVPDDARMGRAYERWQQADGLLMTLLERARERNDPKLLELLESRGQDLPLTTRALIVQARPLVRCLTRQPSPVADECQPHWDAFEIVYQSFEEMVKANSNSSTFWIDTFTHDAHAFKEVAEGALTRVEQGKMPRREREQLERTHQDLLRDADTLRFEFP